MRLFDIDSGRYITNEGGIEWEYFTSSLPLKPWQQYAIECLGNIASIPPYVTAVVGNRFSCYEETLIDTIFRNGAIAATTLSLLFRPKVVVEMGVKAGHTALLLSKLNPQAEVHGVDITSVVDSTKIPTGYVAFMNHLKNYHLHFMNSWDFEMSGKVDLCFIDADHDEEPVYLDSCRAWENRNKDGDWCIAWDDYHKTNGGVVRSVDRFCEEVGYELQKAWSWYWIGTKTMNEAQLSEI